MGNECSCGTGGPMELSLDNQWPRERDVKMTDVIDRCVDRITKIFDERGCHLPGEDSIIRFLVEQALDDSAPVIEEMYLSKGKVRQLSMKDKFYKPYDSMGVVSPGKKTGYSNFATEHFVKILRNRCYHRLLKFLQSDTEAYIDKKLRKIEGYLGTHRCAHPTGNYVLYSRVRAALAESELPLKAVYIEQETSISLTWRFYQIEDWFNGSYAFQISNYIELLKKVALEKHRWLASTTEGIEDLKRLIREEEEQSYEEEPPRQTREDDDSGKTVKEPPRQTREDDDSGKTVKASQQSDTTAGESGSSSPKAAAPIPIMNPAVEARQEEQSPMQETKLPEAPPVALYTPAGRKKKMFGGLCGGASASKGKPS